ncbi:hypothetical protein AB6D11_03650 [Vibrio splendidus]
MPISRSKSLLLKLFHYDYHPLTQSLIELDTFALRSDRVLSLLSDEQLAILLRSTTLHVSRSSNPERYWLLQPNPTFDVLKLHPNASKHPISLCVHDDPLAAIAVLMFVQPALDYQYNKKPLTLLANRLQAAKQCHHNKPRLAALIPKKGTLAQFANTASSSLRHDQ